MSTVQTYSTPRLQPFGTPPSTAKHPRRSQGANPPILPFSSAACCAVQSPARTLLRPVSSPINLGNTYTPPPYEFYGTCRTSATQAQADASLTPQWRPPGLVVFSGGTAFNSVAGAAAIPGAPPRLPNIQWGRRTLPSIYPTRLLACPSSIEVCHGPVEHRWLRAPKVRAFPSVCPPCRRLACMRQRTVTDR
jgi:hypothetical protein